MGLFKQILIDAEECGLKGFSSSEAFNFLKKKYDHVDFNGEDFNLNGPVFDAYVCGYAEFDLNHRILEDFWGITSYSAI